MTKTISILGSTGSIGRQTLDVVRHLPIQVAALTAGTNVERMAEQVAQFHPRMVSMATPEAAEALKRLLPQPAPEILWGEQKSRHRRQMQGFPSMTLPCPSLLPFPKPP